MAIIAYPLNNITYDALDAQTYFSFRKSGVNSYYDDFIVTAKEGMTITVSAGLGWMKPDDFMGFSVASTEPIDITLEPSHATMGRYDRIVARYDAASSIVDIVAKTGTPATDPQPPAIERTTSIYELGFCTIYVGPSVSSVTSGDIADTRSDSEVCGISGDSSGSGRSQLKITFPSGLYGQPYTVTNTNGPVYSGYVPVSLVDYVSVDTQNMQYTVNTTDSSGNKYTGSVTVGQYFGQYAINVEKEYVGPTYPESMADATWSQLHELSAAGKLGDYYDVGDSKPVTLNGTAGSVRFNHLSVNAFLVGVNHNPSREGNNKSHFQLGKIGGKHVAFCDSKYNQEGSRSDFCIESSTYQVTWSNCNMRNNVLGAGTSPNNPGYGNFIAALPSDLRAVMQSCQKYSYEPGSSTWGGSVKSTTDYLTLPSEFEVMGSINVANSSEQNYQAQYQYYKNGNSKICYNHSATNQPVECWTRSSSRSSPSTMWCSIGNSSMSESLMTSLGISPIFFV